MGGKNRGTDLKDLSIYKISSIIILLFTAVLLALFLWLGNTTFFILKTVNNEPVSPLRWLFSILISLTFTVGGLKKKSISKSGALFGFVVGLILSLGSYAFLISLLVFFVSSSKATKFRSTEKKKLEHDFKEGGQRNWVQVICNGGMATVCSMFYILDGGCGEKPIDFLLSHRQSWYALGVLGALASANGDTWASELGSVLSNSKPWLITSFKRVPKGVNGGVSLWGLIVSALGGLVVGLGFWLTLVLLTDTSESSVQWPIIPLATAVGFIGSIVDSILGATLQFSGIDENGVVVECPGKGVVHVSGVGLLDNHSVNLVTSVIMGFLTPRIAYILWP